MSILEKIVADKMDEVRNLKTSTSLDQLMDRALACESPRGFGRTLTARKYIALIAEIKRASPSRGPIRDPLVAGEIAPMYEKGGAAAISVLTEENHFRGKPQDLAECREASTLPILRKDFIIDPHQVPESRIMGADAVLLIVACLEDSLLGELLALAREMSLDALVEVHNEEELGRAITAGADIIGINNRNLATFEVDLQTTFDLLPKVPEGRTIVSESGIQSHLDVALLHDAGADAILVGESLLRQPNIQRAVRILLG